MTGHHFISYSRRQKKTFANKLRGALLLESPPVRVWLDTRDLRPGREWDEEIVEAIRNCDSLLFAMTPDSVKRQSMCKKEWARALRYKKPIVPLLLDRKADMPFRLEGRQYIDFTGDFDVGLERLHQHLQWLASPEGELQVLKDRLEDAERDLEVATEPDQEKRIQKEISELEQQIARQESVVENPEEAEEQVQKSIETSKQRERQPEKPVRGTTHTKFINPPPLTAPTYFQDRHVETKLMGDFLNDEAQRLMTVVGRGGIGKTAMVCRLLKSLEGGKLPDDGGEMSVDGIVYLSERGTRGVSVPYVYADLCQLLPENVAEELDKVYKNPQASIEAKMHALLYAFPEGRYVLLLDNFEDMIDPATREIEDAELKGALRTVLEHAHHAIKVILTTRFAPEPDEVALVHPERQRTLTLVEGLPSPYAENILREMDADGTVGLKSAPDELLDEARERTRGFPRALEALFAILSADRDTTLREILDDTEAPLPENVIEALVGEAFSRLDPVAQMVMQALAIYSYPVTPAAVDYLLLPHRPGGVDSASVLGRLVNMQFVRKETPGRYYLRPLTGVYALSRVPEGEATDRDEIDAPHFTRMALLDRAADYLAQTRTPRESWKTIEDLRPQLQEFELRYEGQDYDTAASVLLDIDFYLLLWGHYKSMTEMHERLVGKLSDLALRQNHLRSLGSACYMRGRYQEAIAYTEQALEIAREMEDRQGEGVHLGNLANRYHSLGRYQEAIAYYEQALEIAREMEDRGREGVHLGNLATTYDILGRYQEAVAYYEQALEIARDIGDRANEGSNLGGLGMTYNNLGRCQEAVAYYEQALEIARDIGDRANEGSNLGSLGNSYTYLGRHQEAKAHFEQALEIAREIGDRNSETWLLWTLGALSLDLDQSAYAKEYLEQSLGIAREIHDRRMEAYGLLYLGELPIMHGEWSGVQQLLEHAMRIADEMENQSLQREARMSLARGYLYSGDLSLARTTIGEAREYESQGYNYGLLALVGVIALRTGASEEARDAFHAAVDEAEAQLGHSEQVYGALDCKGLALCGLALATGDEGFVPPATDAYRKAREITEAAGVVADELHLFDALQEADVKGVLAEVREVAAGEPTSAQTREA